MVGENFSVTHHHILFGVLGDVQFVGDHNDGDAAVIQSLEGVHDFDAGLGIEIARRFVSKDQGWIHHQRSGDGHPLLFSAERRLRIKHGQIDVVSGGSARQQVESLKDKPNFLIPNFRSFFRRQAQYIHAVQLVIFIKVDFPKPLASIIAANSPC